MFSFRKKILNFGSYTEFSKYLLGAKPKGETNTFIISLLDKQSFEIAKRFELDNVEMFWGCNKSEDEFYYSDYDYNIHKLDIFDNNNIILKNMFLLGNWDFEGKILIDDRQNEQICIFDANTNEVVEVYPKYKGSSPIFFDDYIVYHLYSDKKIAIRDKTSSSLSTFSLPTLKDVYSPFPDWEVWYFVGVVEGVLWIDLRRNGSAKGALLGLEAQTGAVKHFLHQASPQTEGGFDFIPSSANTQYDPQTHKLIAFGNYHYWEVDLKQSPYEVKIWNLEERLRAVKAILAPGRVNAVNDTHIFSMTGALGSIDVPQVYALNRKTLQVDWRYVFEPDLNLDYYTPTKAEVTDTHLFVLDSQGTLHIFEKEE